MTIRTILFKSILLSFAYVMLLRLYLLNELNKHLIGIIFDSFWLTGVSTLYIIFLLQKTGLWLYNSYFRIKKIEYSGKIYNTIGMKYFKKIIQKYPLPNVTLKIDLKGKSKSDILNLENRMREAEQIHIFGFLLTLIISIFFALQRDIRFLLWFTVFNIIMNLYPTFLQRYNRNRIRLILDKLN